MILRHLRVKNYMIHRDTAIDLQPLTVLVGPNGGGKSALFDALLNFSMVSRGNLRQAFGPYPFSFRSTIYRGASKVSKICFGVVMSRSIEDSEALEYEIEYTQTGSADDEPQFTITSECVTKRPDGKVLFDRRNPDAYAVSRHAELENDRSLFAAIRYAQGSPSADVDDLLAYCAEQISRFNRFRLDPGVLAQPSRLPDPSGNVAPRLGYHGEDLAATLYHLSETRDPALDSIREKVKVIDQQFTDFDFNTVGTGRIAFSAVYGDPRQTVPSVRLSAGTLIFIGLITLVTTSSRPPVLMIEEPENGLTPQAIRAFYDSVRTLALNEDPARRSQVLLSSHSPFVICEAWNGEDRDFIFQVKVEEGRALVRKFGKVVEEQGIHLSKEKSGARTILGLSNAEAIMSGYMS